LGSLGETQRKKAGKADIAMRRLHTGSVSFADSEKKRLDGDRWLECLATIRAGIVLYNPQGIDLPA